MRAKPLLSLEEYERLPDEGNRYELDEGELVLMTVPKKRHLDIQQRIRDLLTAYVAPLGLGTAYSEAGYVLSKNPPILRIPDVSFLSAKRWAETAEDQWFSGAPELAVEIISPSDRPKQLQRKLDQYLAAGALVVWLVYPDKHEVHVHEPGARVRMLRSGDTIQGTGPLAGFSASVESFFGGQR